MGNRTETLIVSDPTFSTGSKFEGVPQPGARVAVISTNWIGDAVMSLPALRELRRLLPGVELHLLVREWVAELYLGQGVADVLIRLPVDVSLTARTIWTARRLQGFDTVILFPNSFASALQAVLAGVPNRIGYATDGRGWLLTRQARPRIQRLRRHQIYYYLDLLYQTGLSRLNYLEEERFQPDIRLQTDDRAIQEAEHLLAAGEAGRRPLIVLNPGAFFGSAKRWFPDRYASLADQLIESLGAEVVLIGSPGERKLAAHIRKLMKKRPVVLTGKTTLCGLLGLLSSCDLLITNDSGPMHLAAALGTPQIALFGSTDEIATGPLNQRATVIHKHVPCSPCLLRECPIDLRCFDRIGVEEVLSAARQCLS